MKNDLTVKVWRNVIVGFHLPTPAFGGVPEGEAGRVLHSHCAECFGLIPMDLYTLHWERTHPGREIEPPL